MITAALPSKNDDRELINPRPPLDKIEYTTMPLQGTEDRDRAIMQYPIRSQSKQAILAELQEQVLSAQKAKASSKLGRKERRYGDVHRDSASREFIPNDHESDHFRKASSHQPKDMKSGDTNRIRLSTDYRAASRERGSDLDSSKDVTSASQTGDKRMAGIESGSESSQRSDSLKEYNLIPLQGGKTNGTVIEEPSNARKVIDATAGLWLRFMTQAKKAVRSVTNLRASPSPSPNATEGRDSFTEDDVQDMVNDIVRQLQRQNQEKVQSSGLSAPEFSGQVDGISIRQKPRGSLLMLRTKVLVSPNVVADAVMNSAKKMLSEKGEHLSRSTTSRLLREVQDKLEELLQPME